MNRHAAAVAFGVFVVGYGTNVSTPFLVLYRNRLDLGANATQLIFVVYVAGILGSLMISGQLSDRYGRKPVLMASLAVSAVASTLLIFGRDSFTLLMAGRILLGIASGAGLGVGAAWLQEILGKGRELTAALVATAVSYGGFGAAPPVSVLYDWLGSSPLVVPFLIHNVLTLVAGIAVLSASETVDTKSAASQGPWRPKLQFGVPPQARRRFMWYVAPLAVLVFAFPSTAFSLFPVLLSDAIPGREVLLTGLSGTLTAWSGIASRPFLTRVSERSSMGWGAAIGTVGYAIGTVAFMTDRWLLVWPAAIILGAASGIIAAAGLTLIGEMTDEANRGALSSTFYLIAYFGMAMPLFISALSGLFGTTYVLVAITCVAGLLAATAPVRHRLGVGNSASNQQTPG